MAYVCCDWEPKPTSVGRGGVWQQKPEDCTWQTTAPWYHPTTATACSWYDHRLRPKVGFQVIVAENGPKFCLHPIHHLCVCLCSAHKPNTCQHPPCTRSSPPSPPCHPSLAYSLPGHSYCLLPTHSLTPSAPVPTTPTPGHSCPLLLKLPLPMAHRNGGRSASPPSMCIRLSRTNTGLQ